MYACPSRLTNSPEPSLVDNAISTKTHDLAQILFHLNYYIL